MRKYERYIALALLFCVGVAWGIVRIEGARDWLERSPAGTPATGYVRTYAGTDGAMHAIDDAGVDTVLGGGGPACTGEFWSIADGSQASTAEANWHAQTTGVTRSFDGSGDQKFAYENLDVGEAINISAMVPDCYVAETFDLDIYRFVSTSTGTGGIDIKTSCIGDDDVLNSATFNAAQNVTVASLTSGDLDIITQSGLTMTGCEAGDFLSIELTVTTGLSVATRLFAIKLRWS